MISLREIRFFICTIAALMAYQWAGMGMILNGVAINALLNLFSGQHLCVTGSCGVKRDEIILPYLPFELRLSKDPIALFHYATFLVGVLFLVVGAVKIWG
ncbi:MAG: hypothetical protein HQL72_07610 [Magnetococcales bacterium]|nr:hypothetical protein [Magnetococcales bacterium]